jgi:hypothetical protein
MTALTLYAGQSAASADAAALRWRAITSALLISSASDQLCLLRDKVERDPPLVRDYRGRDAGLATPQGLLPANQDRSRRALGEEVGRRGRNYFGRMTPQIVENLLWFYTDPGSSRSM